MARAALRTIAIGLGFCMTVASAAAQDVESFYRGKTVNLYIGSNVGGGYDAYGRLVARHIGKYIPGKPVVVPSNMGGAGGNTAGGWDLATNRVA